MQNELELSTTSILSLFETTKEQRVSFVNDIVERLKNEEVNPLEIHLQVKAMEDIINGLTNRDIKKNKNFEAAKVYHKSLLEAAEKYGKTFMFHNAEFNIKEVGSTYDFSKCEDDELFTLLDMQEKIKEEVEARKNFLKALPLSGMETLNKGTGELVTIYPPSKSSTTAVSVSLK